ncbi:unnamed protein product, partial [Rotaria sp. Silwood2]
MGSRSIVLQMAPCSFDIHIQEIIGTMYFGGTIIMLVPNGNLDLNYICYLIENQQITIAMFVPSSIDFLIDYLNGSSIKHQASLHTLRILCIG